MTTIQPPKRLLFGPGPGMVEPRVYEALSKPVVGHLDPYFFEVENEVRRRLRLTFGTANEHTYAISGTGSAGMETAVQNLVEPDSKFAVLINGYFGERIFEMGLRQGARVARFDKPWGEVFSYGEAAEFFDREKPQVVAFVHAETSTGALNNAAELARAGREARALVIADVVTSLGAVPVNVDACGIDAAYSCTQKGLSCTPGLAPITLSPRAWEHILARKTEPRGWYLDLKLISKYYDDHKYHHTASASLFYALGESLALIEEEGLENRFQRHRRYHETLVRGLESLGLQMHVAPSQRIPNLNTPRVPSGVDDLKVRKHLLEKHGIEVAAGLGPLAGKIFRVGLMGPLANESCVQLFLSAFQKALAT